MRKLLVYILFSVILFSGYQETKVLWQGAGEGIDTTYQSVKEGLFGWFKSASEKTAELRVELSEKLQDATQRYDELKSELNAITSSIDEKQKQLNQTLKEIQEAKEALDTLLDKDQKGETKSSASVETSTSNEAKP